MNLEKTKSKLNGVPGYLTTIEGANGLWRKQEWVSRPRSYNRHLSIRAEVNFDDSCGNGHNTFSITGEVYKPGASDIEMGGCLHEEIAKHFPELAPLIKYHLFSSDEPLHYISNTLYLAGDRCHRGCKKGEPYSWDTVIQFGDNPIQHKRDQRFIKFLLKQQDFDFQVIEVPYKPTGSDIYSYNFGPNYTFDRYDVKWHYCPFSSEDQALRFLYALQHCKPRFFKAETAWSEGKERQLEAARSAACWPEATDEELMQEPNALRKQLEARLPGLIAQFKTDITAAGLYWSPQEC